MEAFLKGKQECLRQNFRHKMSRPTRTTNRLHFSDLDPLRFEDLCLSLVTRLNRWKEISHFGRKGSDLGVDILAVEQENEIEKVWFVQCKRYQTIARTDLTKIVDKVLTNPSPPNKLLVIVSCDVSRELFQHLKDYSREQGISESELWTASTLEAKLYHDHKDLLFVYFGVRIENETKSNAARVKHSLRMEKRVLKELIDYNYIKERNDPRLFLYNPSARFISASVYIRSIDDTTYPNYSEDAQSGQRSLWFRTFFYDTYHKGIEFWLDAGVGTTVIMDAEGSWELVTDYYDQRKEDPRYRVIKAKTIGRIPYHNIVDFKTEGDEYTSEPHLFCKFDYDASPFEGVYYRSVGDPAKEIADWKLDTEKRTTFPKE